mmetsp:Transcript_41217/g.54141  ORF Transcript_41217/g.54141 Transcript_41217/m.54141 type:complete len:253 (-) Transcript_41217:316-1074(-)
MNSMTESRLPSMISQLALKLKRVTHLIPVISLSHPLLAHLLVQSLPLLPLQALVLVLVLALLLQQAQVLPQVRVRRQAPVPPAQSLLRAHHLLTSHPRSLLPISLKTSLRREILTQCACNTRTLPSSRSASTSTLPRTSRLRLVSRRRPPRSLRRVLQLQLSQRHRNLRHLRHLLSPPLHPPLLSQPPPQHLLSLLPQRHLPSPLVLNLLLLARQRPRLHPRSQLVPSQLRPQRLSLRPLPLRRLLPKRQSP